MARPKVSLGLFLGIFALSASIASADQCATGRLSEGNQRIWYCPGNHTIYEPRGFLSNPSSGVAKTCARRCDADGGLGELRSDELIASFPEQNSAWFDEFDQKQYETGDAYTTIRVDLVGKRPSQKSCSRYSAAEKIFRDITGSSNVTNVTFSIVLTEGIYNRAKPSGKGIVVPIFSLKKTVGSDCELIYNLDRDVAVAKVRADSTRNLRVTGIYSYSEERTDLENIESTVNSTFLGTVLNGTLASYAPFVTQVFSLSGFQMTRADHLSVGHSLPVFPQSANDARKFTVRLGRTETISVKVYQQVNVHPEGGLANAGTIEQAVQTPNTVADFDESVLKTVYLSIAKDLNTTKRLDFDIPGAAATDIRGMKTFCRSLDRIATSEYGLSDSALNKLRALAMREYKDPREFYNTRVGRTACVPLPDRPKYQSIILESLTKTEKTDLIQFLKDEGLIDV